MGSHTSLWSHTEVWTPHVTHRNAPKEFERFAHMWVFFPHVGERSVSSTHVPKQKPHLIQSFQMLPVVCWGESALFIQRQTTRKHHGSGPGCRQGQRFEKKGGPLEATVNCIAFQSTKACRICKRHLQQHSVCVVAKAVAKELFAKS